jgi:hypothetical protein
LSGSLEASPPPPVEQKIEDKAIMPVITSKCLFALFIFMIPIHFQGITQKNE